MSDVQRGDPPAYRRFEIPAVEDHEHVEAEQGEQEKDQQGRGLMLVDMIDMPTIDQFVESLAFSPDGSTLADYPLESPPVLDGMAAAGGRLYLATAAGKVVCFRGN